MPRSASRIVTAPRPRPDPRVDRRQQQQPQAQRGLDRGPQRGVRPLELVTDGHAQRGDCWYPGVDGAQGPLDRPVELSTVCGRT